MMGFILVLILVWLTLVLGSLDKGERFWSLTTIILTVAFAVGLGFSFVTKSDASSSGDTELIRFGFKAMLGISFGLAYCVIYQEKILNKRFPLATAFSSMIIGIGGISILGGVVKWLNGIAR